MNKKIFLLLLILIVSAFADNGSGDNEDGDNEGGDGLGNNGGNNGKCHYSCANCEVNVCKACTLPHTHVDPKKRACVCNNNFYAVSLNPLVCEKKISGDEEDRCEKEIALNVSEFVVNTLCYFDTNNNNESIVYSDVSIDTDHCFFDNQDCRSKVVTEVQYRPKGNDDPKEDNQYIHLPDKYVSSLPGGKSGDVRIHIPLIDVYSLAYDQSISNDQSQIVQHIYFRIMIGFARKYVRAHRWCMTVFTNRNQIQTFIIDVDIQRTESCQDGQECIIIADLDVTGNQYKPNWSDLRGNNEYIVGDWMYMRIWFKDSTYTKQLSFQKLYFKNEEDQVFDHTSLTDSNETKWNSGDKSLHVKLRLIEPGEGAVVQVNMLIETLNARLRRLQSTESVTTKQQFKADITNPISTTSYSANQDANDKANSLVILFGLINLLAFVLIY